jgi:hypothetical protein
MHQDLETMLLSLVTKDVFAIVEALVKNKCKGKTLQLFPFYLPHPIFFQFFDFFFFTFVQIHDLCVF